MPHYTYRVHGLNILSEADLIIEQSEIGPADLVIEYAETLPQILHPYAVGNPYRGTRDEVVIDVEEICSLYIGYGKQVLIKKYTEDEALLSCYILGTALSMCLVQRNIFPLHGSTVNYEGKGICIVGYSGVGKSTLSYHFMDIGATLIGDDMTCVTAGDGGLVTHRGILQQKLTNATADHFGIRENDGVYVSHIGKSIINTATANVEDRSRIDCIVELKVSDKIDNALLERLSPMETLQALLKHTSRPWMVQVTKRMEDHFRYITMLAENCRMYRLTRPLEGFTAGEQSALILKELRANESE